MNHLELLAPAGNMDALKQAIHNGADAIYMGGKSFGARAFAGNFSSDEMKQAIDYAHLYNAKVYITVNTLIYQNEVTEFLKHLEAIYKMGADALIMQDVGMIDIAHHKFPDIEIHASTQMHNHNDACLYFIKNLGMTRAVLARETSIEQIKKLTCDIEKEVFIHGALCISYSGQCLFSALTQNRSGNRGRCAQSCRMKYTLQDEGGNTIKTAGNYLLSPKDLALFENLEQLINADVTSFKIEGRMKSPQYVGHITKIYSSLIEKYKNAEKLKVGKDNIDDLKKLFNRGFTKGHLLGDTSEKLMSNKRPNHQGISIGTVKSVIKDKITVTLCDTLNQGDGIKFAQSDTGFVCNKIYLNGKLVNHANSGDTIQLDAKVRVKLGESVLKTSDIKLLKALTDFSEKKILIDANLIAKVGQPIMLTFSDDLKNTITVEGDIVTPSRTRPTTLDELKTSISKLGGTPFELKEITFDCDEDIFIAKSQINALRRKAVEKLSDTRINIAERKVLDYDIVPIKHQQNDTTRLHVLVRNAEQFDAIKDIVVGDIYTADENLYFANKDEYKNLVLKTNKLAQYPTQYKNERLLVTDNGGVHAYHKDNDIMLDYSINALNAHTVAFFINKSAQRIALSPELNLVQIKDIIHEYEQKNKEKPPLEAIIYARHELMAMKHCIISQSGKNHAKCDKCSGKQYYLTDIHENHYPIVTDESCNNYILNSRIEKADVNALKTLGVTQYRLEFFDESGEDCKSLINKYSGKLSL